MTARRQAKPVLAALVLAALLASACQTASAAPAVLTHADPDTMSRLKATLAAAVGRAQVELGPGDPTQSPVISVLPPRSGPLEDRNPAKPMIFRLEIEGETCVLVREDTGVRLALEGIDCRAANP